MRPRVGKACIVAVGMAGGAVRVSRSQGRSFIGFEMLAGPSAHVLARLGSDWRAQCILRFKSLIDRSFTTLLGMCSSKVLKHALHIPVELIACAAEGVVAMLPLRESSN